MSPPRLDPPGFVELRDAARTDAAIIAEVHQASRVAALGDILPREAIDWMTPDERSARWEEWLDDPDWVTLVGTLQGHVLGFCSVGPSRDPDVDIGAVAEMATLYVHPSHWRKGVGRVLCAAAVARAAKLGFRELTLWTLEENQQALLFYGSFGFAPDGTTKVDEEPLNTGLRALRLRIDLM